MCSVLTARLVSIISLTAQLMAAVINKLTLNTFPSKWASSVNWTSYQTFSSRSRYRTLLHHVPVFCMYFTGEGEGELSHNMWTHTDSSWFIRRSLLVFPCIKCADADSTSREVILRSWYTIATTAFPGK
jgi:hypothetical protein